MAAEPRNDVPAAGSLRDRLTARWGGLFGVTARKGSLALVDQAVVSGANFLTSVMLGRLCGPDELGVYALGLTFVVLIVGVQNSLILVPYTVYGNRLTGTDRAEYAGSILVHQAVLIVAAMASLAATGLALSAAGSGRLVPVTWMLVGIIPFALLREFARRWSFAHLHVGAAVALDVAVAVIQVGGLVGLALSGRLGAGSAFAVMGLACGVAGIAWLGSARSRFIVNVKLVSGALRRNWSLSRWVFGSQVASMLGQHAIVWLLALILDTGATGLFAACMAVVMFSNPFILGVSNVLGPRVAKAFADGGAREVRRVVAKATLLLGAAMVGFCLLVAIFGQQVIVLLYGSQYAGYQHAIIVVALTVLANALELAPGHGLVVLERSDLEFQARLLCLVLTVLAGLCLIGPAGVTGAAYSLLAGRAAAAALTWVRFRTASQPAPRYLLETYAT